MTTKRWKNEKGKHTGHRSCFYRKVDGGTLVETGETVFDPKKVYNKQ